jgi:hypothetical protein
MKGKYELIISNNKLKYDLVLERNITVIKGDSGTGKSILYNMCYELIRQNRPIGINCNCRDRLVILNNEDTWKEQLSKCKDNIVIINEWVEFTWTQEFKNAVKNSDNYFIIISRSASMSSLVDSFYCLETEKEDDIFCIRLCEINA